jgi:hypothetical protein
MGKKRTIVADVLANYHGGHPVAFHVAPSPEQVEVLIAAGLGPIAFQVLTQATNLGIPQVDPSLKSADLTTRVIYAGLHRATVEILRQAHAAGIEVTLLKGISIAEEIYTPPHHRIMGDIDILVRPVAAERMNDLVQSLGYLPIEPEAHRNTRPNHHHLPGLKHPKTGVTIEIHTALASHALLTHQALMQPVEFHTQLRPSIFGGVPCCRLSLEYQLVHTAIHWALDGKWPVNVISINDLLHLLNHPNGSPDWGTVAAWMEGSAFFAEILAVIVLYLADCDLAAVPVELEAPIAAARRRLGQVNLRILHWLLGTFPLSGRRKVGWVLTRLNARIIWLTLLEPRSRYLRLPVAVSRVVFKRTRGKSLLGSVPGRIRTLLKPNG